MGVICSNCLKGDTNEVIQPDLVARRRMQEEAAERRRQETENRGIKDPEKVRRQQERARQMERDELEAAKQGTGGPNLRWQAS